MHILIMPSWYKTPETSVLGTFFEEQARALEKEGHFVGIIYPEYTPPGEIFSGSNKEHLDFYMDKNIPTFNIKAHAGIPKMRRWSYKQFGKSVNVVFEEYVKNFGQPDIIHAHSVFHAGIAGFHIAKVHKIPFVITEHLTAFLMGYITNKIDIEISREIYEYADKALIVSHNFRKDLENQLHLKENTFQVIHNLINSIFLENVKIKTYSPGETFHFMTNSFLLPRKNIKLIVDAIHILTKKKLDVHLTIGGEGPLEDELREYVRFLGLDKQIRFTGKLWRNEVKDELDKCHAFVLASQYETFGVVLIESLACGRPVVTTDSGGPRDFIHPEHGIIVEKQELFDFAAAMEKLMLNYASYDQKSLSAYCKTNFNEHRIAEEMTEVYYSAINNRIKKLV
ncbi:MAG: glycosyltransferase [Bacteroidetes bacterium]|nr:glycosyltransferase [Bacteroidota bacterium]